jgi:23S rRNA (cytosine1962-C5)-methyltransferase
VKREAAGRVRSGHPWIFREALVSRGELPEAPGQIVTVQDQEGRFLGQGLWEPDGAVAIRIVTRDPEQLPSAELYAERANLAIDLREKLVEEEVEAYRIINSEGDLLPGLTVDRYGDFLVAQLFTEAARPMAEAVYPVILERLQARGIYEQRRLRPTTGEKRAPASLVLGKASPVDLIVSEYGIRFAVDVTAPLGVGLFPDLREARWWVGQQAEGKRILNQFSYTGAFTVHALAGGAAQVVAVDLSAKLHAWARKNIKLNDLDPEARCRHLSADVTAALARLEASGERFDLAILDPPSFSRGPAGTFSTARDFGDLVTATLRLMAPGGQILAVSNTAKLSDDEFCRAVGRGGLRAGRELRVVRRFSLPPDFPSPPAFTEGLYLKAYLLTS